MTEESGSFLNPDERAIRAVEATYDAAWQAGDIEGLLACLAEYAVLVNPHKKLARGHTEIRRELEGVLSGSARGSRHTSLISRLEFLTSDVAVVDGEAVVDIPRQGETASQSLTHQFTNILVKGNKRWETTHVCAYSLTTRG